jgi:succinate-acetate transporter protein
MFISVLLLNILVIVFAAYAVVAAYGRFWFCFQAVILTSTKSLGQSPDMHTRLSEK